MPSWGFACCGEPLARRMDRGRGDTEFGRHWGGCCVQFGKQVTTPTNLVWMGFCEPFWWDIYNSRVGVQAARCPTSQPLLANESKNFLWGKGNTNSSSFSCYFTWPGLRTTWEFCPPLDMYAGWVVHNTCPSEISECLTNTSYPQGETQTPSDW